MVFIVAMGGCANPVESTDFDSDSTGPLTVLPPCDERPAPSGDPAVPGLVVPDETIITDVTPQPPVTSVRGYLEMTPVQVRAHYAERDDVDVLHIEDEVFEAEILLASGAHRLYVKAMASCAEGSHLLAIVAPDVDADGLPVPEGQPDMPASEG